MQALAPAAVELSAFCWQSNLYVVPAGQLFWQSTRFCSQVVAAGPAGRGGGGGEAVAGVSLLWLELELEEDEELLEEELLPGEAQAQLEAIAPA